MIKADLTKEQLAQKMQKITDKAIKGLGNWVSIDEYHRAMVEEAKGILVCPWPHAGRFAKRVTVLENTQTGEAIKWSDLNIHLIKEHGFFEGKGSTFRVEPGKIIKMIFSEQ